MEKKVKNRIMTVAEREALTDKIRQESEFRDAVKRNDLAPGIAGPTSDLGSKEINTDGLDKNITHLKRVLAEGTPETISGHDRERAEARRKELAEALKEKLLTHREMDLMPKDGYEYHRAVRKSTAQEVGNPQTQRMMEEYRNLSAKLDPNNPEAQSLEALRRDR